MATDRVDGLQNRVFLEPLLRGRYPDDVMHATQTASDWSFVLPGDLARIATPIDLLGINYYTPLRVVADQDSLGRLDYPGTLGIRILPAQGDLTDMGWEIAPEGLTDLLVWVWQEYRIPCW